MHEKNSENYTLTQKIRPDMMLFFLASCPLNAEDLLSKEIRDMGAQDIEKIPAGVYFSGNIDLLYRGCLWARIASSIKLIVKRFNAQNKEALYQQVLNYPWFDHLSPENTFACRTTCSRKAFAPTHFLTLLMKDGIADSFRRIGASRPNVSSDRANIIVALHMDGEKATLSLELGRSLQERPWRANSDVSLHGTVLKRHAPWIEENLAATLLHRMQWPKAAQEGKIFFDPYCTEGVFLMEAAAMACDYAPALHKAFVGFEYWRQFDKDAWQAVKNQAVQRFEQAIEKCPPLFGYTHENKLKIARRSLEKSPFGKKVQIQKGDLFASDVSLQKGLMILMPPYGDVFKDPQKVRSLYQNMGAYLKGKFGGWDIGVILPSEELLRELDVRTERLNTFYHGIDKCYLARFMLYDKPRETAPLTKGAQALKNDLEKQYKKIIALAKESWNTNAYRLYNNTHSDYPALCDIYDDTLIVQVFASTPKIKELTRVCQEICGISRPNTLIKKRRRISTDDQYMAEKQTVPLEKVIFEGKYRYFTNLSTYIDTGFYLDHRPLRRRLEQEAQGKSFLNLFCYTASMSIVAASCGASHVCSVDTSKTYLNMAQKNARLNKLESASMQWVRADVQEFLSQNEQKWDIIYVDPPTYSNGTGRRNFDIQRDHISLLHRCATLLNKKGWIYFSTHFKKFTMDTSLEKQYYVENITEKSLDEDCTGRQISHYLWKIRLKR